MKQTIPTVYPPPPNRSKTTHAKKRPQKLNGFHQGSLAGRQLPPPPTFPFCYATSKKFEWADGCSTLCAGWDRVCPCLVPPSSSFALIRFLRFCKTLVRKMHMNYTTKHLM